MFLPVALQDFSISVNVAMWVLFGIFLGFGVLACCGAALPYFSNKGIVPKTRPIHSKENESNLRIYVKKVKIILNPHGGMQMAKSRYEKYALPLFKKHNVEVELIESQFAGHIQTYASHVDFDGSFDCLIVFGGDGSIHELINGLMSRHSLEGVCFSCLPGGTGNSLLTSVLGRKLNPDGSDTEYFVKGIIDGKVKKLDLNKIKMNKSNDGDNKVLYSMNTIGVGLGGNVGLLAEIYRDLGENRYDTLAAWSIMKGSYVNIKLKVDRKLVWNGKSLGFLQQCHGSLWKWYASISTCSNK